MKVKIKTWEAMEDEYGMDAIGCVSAKYGFSRIMENQMPSDRIIEVDEHNVWSGFCISEDMIEEVIDPYEEMVEEAEVHVSVVLSTYKKFTEMTDAERKQIPVYDGFIRYFPNAIVAVAQNSMKGNEQHNPGKPLFWDRTKSKDEAGSGARHLIDQAIYENEADIEGQIEAAKAKAWRAMANLEKLLESVFEGDSKESEEAECIAKLMRDDFAGDRL